MHNEEQTDEQKVEVRSFTALDLDVQKLEERLEMASAVPNADCYHDSCPDNQGSSD